MAIITPEELVGQISASRQPLGQLRTIDNIDGGISASGKIVGTKVGCKGNPGDAATIEIGTVSTVSSTTPASVVNVGTSTNAIFNFEIPKGADGSGGGGTWGGITGTLSDQTDLKNALDNKIDKSLTAGLVKNDGTIDSTTYSTFSGNYSDLSGKPTIPTVNDKKITIQKNGTNVDYFTTNNSANKTINITVPTDTNDLTNSAGFITNSVNDLINYFKKADSTLPVYFVNSSEHNTSGTAFNLTDKPIGLYLFLPNGTTPFDMYITPRTGANTVSFLSILFFAIHIENVLPSVYVSNQINYAFALLGDGKYRSYELSDEGTEIVPTWITKQFITADENNTITGELTFSTLPKSSITPTNDDHLTRKKYVDDLLSAFKEAAYPIGKTELFYDNLDHSDYLGFTWVLDFEGQFPVGLDTNDTDFDTIGKTGGSKAMERHRHGVEYSTDGGTTWADGAIGKTGAYEGNYYIATAGNKIGAFSSYQARIKEAGTGDSGNLPPFKVVAIWRRTA